MEEKKTLCLDVNQYDSILTLKEKICSKEGISIENQLLFLDYKLLANNRNLYDYCIHKHRTLRYEVIQEEKEEDLTQEKKEEVKRFQDKIDYY